MNTEGDTQEAAPDDFDNAYESFLGQHEESDTEAEPTDESAEESEPEESDTSENTEAPDATATEGGDSDWRKRYEELHSKFGQQGQEVGELKKQLNELRESQQKNQEPEDPFADSALLSSLDENQKSLLLEAGRAAARQLLRESGLDPSELGNLKQTVEVQAQMAAQRDIESSIERVKEQYGSEEFQRRLPQMKEIASRNPGISVEDAFKLASYDDLKEGQSKRVEKLTKERGARAASADFGRESPNKPNSNPKLSMNELLKMPEKQRFRAILKEQMRDASAG